MHLKFILLCIFIMIFLINALDIGLFTGDVTLNKYVSEVMKPQKLDTLGNGMYNVSIW